MEYKTLFVCLCLLLGCPAAGQASPVDTHLPGIGPAMLRAEFWISQMAAPQQVLLTPQEIVQFNMAIVAALPRDMAELADLPDTLAGAVLRQKLAAEKLPRGKERYTKGELVGGAFYDQLERNLNVGGVRDSNPVSWGFTVRRTDLRTFPTEAASSEDEESDDFDLFQETAVNIAEPVAVLHRSGDRRWLYVQLYNYRGWLRAEDVAIAASRADWQTRRNPAAFVVITGVKVAPRESVQGKPVPDWRAGMGTRLPLLGREGDGYTVELPQRNADGTLAWRQAWIHGKADVSTGFLPYTRAAVIRQAFKMLGESYGWGGLGDGHDCSSFVMDILAVFGIRAPRNADQQERSPGRRVVLQNVPDAAGRYALLATQAEPGATLHMRNHVLLYLGQANGKHYAIHDLGSYGDISSPRADGTLPRVAVMGVVVSELDLHLRSGKRFVEALTSAHVWRN